MCESIIFEFPGDHVEAFLGPSWSHLGIIEIQVHQNKPKMSRREPREPKMAHERPSMAQDKPKMVPRGRVVDQARVRQDTGRTRVVGRVCLRKATNTKLPTPSRPPSSILTRLNVPRVRWRRFIDVYMYACMLLFSSRLPCMSLYIWTHLRIYRSIEQRDRNINISLQAYARAQRCIRPCRFASCLFMSSTAYVHRS